MRARWIQQARPKQIPPDGDEWLYFLVLAGRGFGKTKLAMEDAAWYGSTHPGERIALIAATYADARDTMVEGDSGLLACLPRSYVATWNRSLGELILINGTRYKLFAATEPDRLRGPQHNRCYCDELAAWEYPETWDQMMFGLRLGERPRVIIATTPKPTPLIRKIIADPRTITTRGSTFDNAANLATSTLDQLRARYSGTRLGRQELNAEILDDVPGALWTRDMIDAARKPIRLPDMQRVVVAIDPSGARGADDDGADSIGIVVAGKGVDGRGYVLADYTCKLSPDGWGRRAVEAYRKYKADRIIAERNYGGAMVEAVIRAVDPKVSYKEVVASRGKVVRAEPVAAFYEQSKVSHVGDLTALEDQMINMASDGYLGDGSPDRCDACLVAGTMIRTSHGLKPIETVAVGDLVMTRQGWRGVVWSGQTQVYAPTVTLSLSNGRSLVGTSEHPILVGVSFQALGDVCAGSQLFGDDDPAWRQNAISNRSKCFSSAAHTGDILTARINQSSAISCAQTGTGSKRFIGMCGKAITALFLMADTFITKTGIGLTTKLATSNACRRLNMDGGMLANAWSKNLLLSTMHGFLRLNGTAQKLVSNFIPSLENALGITGNDGLLAHAHAVGSKSEAMFLRKIPKTESDIVHGHATGQWPTVIADIQSKPNAQAAGRPSYKSDGETALNRVPVHVLGRSEGPRQPVYNLHVDGCHEFIAEGVVVHNCVWALSELLVEPQPRPTRAAIIPFMGR
jgi:phage terminase large subunit-like protein